MSITTTTTKLLHHPSLESVGRTYAALQEIARGRGLSFGVWVREFHPGRVRFEWSAHIDGLGRRDAQTADFLLEQIRELDAEDARARKGPTFGEYAGEGLHG